MGESVVIAEQTGDPATSKTLLRENCAHRPRPVTISDEKPFWRKTPKLNYCLLLINLAKEPMFFWLLLLDMASGRFLPVLSRWSMKALAQRI